MKSESLPNFVNDVGSRYFSSLSHTLFFLYLISSSNLDTWNPWIDKKKKEQSIIKQQKPRIAVYLFIYSSDLLNNNSSTMHYYFSFMIFDFGWTQILCIRFRKKWKLSMLATWFSFRFTKSLRKNVLYNFNFILL